MSKATVYARRRAAGLCAINGCPDPLAPRRRDGKPGTLCLRHRTRNNRASTKAKQIRKEWGLCQDCGDLCNGLTRCSGCATAQAVKASVRRPRTHPNPRVGRPATRLVSTS